MQHLQHQYCAEIIPCKAQFQPMETLTFQLQCKGIPLLVEGGAYRYEVLDQNKRILQGEGRLSKRTEDGLKAVIELLPIAIAVNLQPSYL